MRPQQQTRQGNRTGAYLQPQQTAEMIQGTEEFGPTSRGDAQSIAAVRIRYSRDREPVGTMPPTDKAIAVALLDKLGARMAFERAGTRLYDALISKLDAFGTFPDGPSREDLVNIREEEHHHVVLVKQMIEKLGGDPTVVTPCANLQLTASRGLVDVLTDPRTDLLECLETILIAELADGESWLDLVAVAKDLGKELVPQIEAAQKTEAEHLTKLRAWLSAARTQMTKMSNPSQRR
jgi:hypothetical protein